jgi:hypothetical protein
MKHARRIKEAPSTPHKSFWLQTIGHSPTPGTSSSKQMQGMPICPSVQRHVHLLNPFGFYPTNFNVGLPPTIQEFMKSCLVNKSAVDICQVVKDEWEDSLIGKSELSFEPNISFCNTKPV